MLKAIVIYCLCSFLQEGDHYVIPSGVMHSAKGIDTPSLALDIFNPPREEYKF